MKGIIGRLRAIFSSLFEFEEDEDAIRVTTALLLPSGDYVVLYVRKSQQGYEVTDNGETLNAVKNLGWHMPAEELAELCNNFCVQVDGEVLRCLSEGSIDLARSIIWTAQAVASVMFIAGMRNK